MATDGDAQQVEQVKLSKIGRYFSVPYREIYFVAGLHVSYIVANYQLMVLITLLTNGWNLALLNAVCITNIQGGLQQVLVILTSYLADTFVGNSKMLLFSAILYCIGLFIWNFKVQSSDSEVTEKHEMPVMWIFLCLALITVGQCGYDNYTRTVEDECNDQEENERGGEQESESKKLITPDGRKRLRQSWFCRSLMELFKEFSYEVIINRFKIIGFIIAVGLNGNFFIISIMIALSSSLFLVGKLCFYPFESLEESPLQLVFRVFRVAYKRRKYKVNKCLYFEGENDADHRAYHNQNSRQQNSQSADSDDSLEDDNDDDLQENNDDLSAADFEYDVSVDDQENNDVVIAADFEYEISVNNQDNVISDAQLGYDATIAGDEENASDLVKVKLEFDCRVEDQENDDLVNCAVDADDDNHRENIEKQEDQKDDHHDESSMQYNNVIHANVDDDRDHPCRRKKGERANECEDHNPTTEAQAHTGLTNRFRCLNKAALYDPNKEKQSRIDFQNGKLCTVKQVLQAKKSIRITRLSLIFMMYGIMRAVSSTFFVEQADNMYSYLGSYSVPVQVIIYSSNVTEYLVRTKLSKWFLARQVRKRRTTFYGTIRVGLGMVLSVPCFVTAFLVEQRRQKALKNDELISAFWLLPQYSLMGAVNGLVVVDDFFDKEMPEVFGRSSYGSILAEGITGIGKMLSLVLLSVVYKITKRGGKSGWIGHDIDHSHVAYYYALMAGFGCVCCVIYAVVAFTYRRHQLKELKISSNISHHP